MPTFGSTATSPSPARKDGGPRDDFEREAIRALRGNPDSPFYRFEEFEGRPSLRYAIGRGMLAMCRYGAADVLAHINVPTLVVAGAQDSCCRSEASRFMAEAIPGAELLVLLQAPIKPSSTVPADGQQRTSCRISSDGFPVKWCLSALRTGIL